MHSLKLDQPSRAAAFTLVELAVVVVVIGILAAFAVPGFISSVEQSKAAEAFNYLLSIHTAQERHHARQGAYASEFEALEAYMVTPEFFSVGPVTVPSGHDSLVTGWELTLTRTGSSAGYGAYTVVFNQAGFDPGSSTIKPEISPLTSSGE